MKNDDLLSEFLSTEPKDKSLTLYAIGEPKYFGELPVRTELTIKREKTEKPIGWFSIQTTHDRHVVHHLEGGILVEGDIFERARCDRMHELSFWKHRIKRAYVWYSLKRILKTRRLDWWNHGISD